MSDVHSTQISSLSLYYLQQMGIEPWLLRNAQSSLSLNLPMDSQVLPAECMVILDSLPDCVSTDFSAERLLNRMLQSIGLSTQTVALIHWINNAQQQMILATQIAELQPRVIIAMGDHVQQWFIEQGATLKNQQHDYQGIPVLMSDHPLYLLKNTQNKKKTYMNLVQINTLLPNRLI